MHIHVSYPDGEAKFRLESTIERARNIGLSSSKMKEAQRLVESRKRRSPMSGTTTLEAEVTNVFGHCVWMLIDDEELALPYSEFPWLKAGTIQQILNILRPSVDHLYWPDLDIDLSIESIRNPEKFPLKANSTFQSCRSPDPPPVIH